MVAEKVDFGLGLRPEHFEEIAANPGRVNWFEALSENYMVPGGNPLHWLDQIRRDYPMAMHACRCRSVRSTRSTQPISTG